ncbi:unnamed protein product, partial [Closterium sp. NIES-54]
AGPGGACTSASGAAGAGGVGGTGAGDPGAGDTGAGGAGAGRARARDPGAGGAGAGGTGAGAGGAKITLSTGDRLVTLISAMVYLGCSGIFLKKGPPLKFLPCLLDARFATYIRGLSRPLCPPLELAPAP